jgi:hypothetical protein
LFSLVKRMRTDQRRSSLSTWKITLGQFLNTSLKDTLYDSPCIFYLSYNQKKKILIFSIKTHLYLVIITFRLLWDFFFWFSFGFWNRLSLYSADWPWPLSPLFYLPPKTPPTSAEITGICHYTCMHTSSLLVWYNSTMILCP